MIQGLQIICLRGKVCVFFYTAEALSPGSGMAMGICIWGVKLKRKAKGALKSRPYRGVRTRYPRSDSRDLVSEVWRAWPSGV